MTFYSKLLQMKTYRPELCGGKRIKKNCFTFYAQRCATNNHISLALIILIKIILINLEFIYILFHTAINKKKHTV